MRKLFAESGFLAERTLGTVIVALVRSSRGWFVQSFMPTGPFKGSVGKPQPGK